MDLREFEWGLRRLNKIRIEIPPSIPWTETFTGTNGDPADVNFWNDISTGSATAQIQSDKLRISASGAESGQVQLKWYVEGDFEILVDWDIINGPSTNDWYCTLYARVDSNNYMVLSRLYYGAFGGHRMVTDGYKGGVYYSNVVGTSDTTGKSRIVRSGSTWTGSYYDYDDVTWYTVGSHTISTAPVEIRLANWYATSNAGSTFDFDNFTINTGTIGSEI